MNPRQFSCRGQTDNEAASEDFPDLANFFTATLFRYPTNVEVVLGIVETEENG
jgi:hypothetical protein